MHAREIFNLIPHDGNSALIGSVELEDARGEEEWAVERFCQCENGGCLSGAGRTIEEHMWEVGGLEGALEGRDGVVLGCDVREGFRAAEEERLA